MAKDEKPREHTKESLEPGDDATQEADASRTQSCRYGETMRDKLKARK